MDRDSSKVNYGLIFTVIITLTGWGVTFGICQNKIDQNTKDISRLEKTHNYDIGKLSDRQNNTDVLLQSINTQLVELNTKMTLLLNGKIATSENEK